MAREMGRHVVPIWIPTMHLKSDGKELFGYAEPEQQGGLPCGYVRLGASSVVNGGFRHSAKSTERLVVLDFDLQWLPISDARNAFERGNRVEFKFQSDLIEGADALIGSLVRPYLAVHIRQTDFVATKYGKSISYYQAEILSALQKREGQKFRTLLVSSDDRVDISSSIAGLFENVVMLIAGKRRQEAGVASEALVHLLVLGMADGFIGTPQSSFSEFAEAMHSGSVGVAGLVR
jgi:hypothetical protein